MLMEIAVGAGADDYEQTDDGWSVQCAVELFDAVTKALEAANISVQESALEYLPKVKKVVTGRDAEVMINLTDALDDHDDVQNVFGDFDIPDDELAKLAGE